MYIPCFEAEIVLDVVGELTLPFIVTKALDIHPYMPFNRRAVGSDARPELLAARMGDAPHSSQGARLTDPETEERGKWMPRRESSFRFDAGYEKLKSIVRAIVKGMLYGLTESFTKPHRSKIRSLANIRM